jgi:hypothetical protein
MAKMEGILVAFRSLERLTEAMNFFADGSVLREGFLLIEGIEWRGMGS